MLSRVLAAYSGLRSDEIIAAIVRCIFCNLDVANAILDLIDFGSSPPDSARAYLNSARELGDAIGILVAELTNGPSQQYLTHLSSSTEAFLARTQPVITSFLRPMSPLKGLPTDSSFFRRVGRDIAHGCWSQRGFVRLGSAPVDLTANNGQLTCIINGQSVYSFTSGRSFTVPDRGVIEFGICAECGASQRSIRVSSEKNGLLFASDDDPHLAGAFRHQRLAELVEQAQQAADLLAGASVSASDTSDMAEAGPDVAAFAVKDIVSLTGFTLDLPSLSETGVADAIGNDTSRLQTLARLSNEFSARRSNSGRAVVAGSVPIAVENRQDLDRRLKSATGLPLEVETRGGVVVMW